MSECSLLQSLGWSISHGMKILFLSLLVKNPWNHKIQEEKVNILDITYFVTILPQFVLPSQQLSTPGTH